MYHTENMNAAYIEHENCAYTLEGHLAKSLLLEILVAKDKLDVNEFDLWLNDVIGATVDSKAYINDYDSQYKTQR
jgi:hypothetical protein